MTPKKSPKLPEPVEGVRKITKTKMWIAEALINGKLVYLGEFGRKDHALTAFNSVKDRLKL